MDGFKKQTDLPQYKENEQKIRREIAILKKCAHPHVVRLREVIDDPASRKIYLGDVSLSLSFCFFKKRGGGEEKLGTIYIYDLFPFFLFFKTLFFPVYAIH